MALNWPLQKYSILKCNEDLWEDVTCARENDVGLVLELHGEALVMLQDSIEKDRISLARNSQENKGMVSKGFILVIPYLMDYKLRLKFVTEDSLGDCCEQLEVLTLVKHSKKYKPISELFRAVLCDNIQANHVPTNAAFPQGFDLKGTIEQYIMHPLFPELVGRVEHIMKRNAKL
jgi:hypothetical protein